jgi:hypothetical protein
MDGMVDTELRRWMQECWNNDTTSHVSSLLVKDKIGQHTEKEGPDIDIQNDDLNDFAAGMY